MRTSLFCSKNEESLATLCRKQELRGRRCHHCRNAHRSDVTSNFAFVQATLPALSADCLRAESYLASDPRSACFYGRRAAEELVAHLYEVMGLALPYQDDLAARINDATSRPRSAMPSPPS